MAGHKPASVLFESGKPLGLVDLEIPDLKQRQVLVDIVHTGVCHTQLLEISGQRRPDRFLTNALDHDASGTVLEVGEGVTKVGNGDHVVLSWIKGTRDDVPSTVYKGPDGRINSGAISEFMQQTVAWENQATTIPDEVPLRETAMLGCASPTGAGTGLNTAPAGRTSSIAVFGVD